MWRRHQHDQPGRREFIRGRADLSVSRREKLPTLRKRSLKGKEGEHGAEGTLRSPF